MSTFTYDVFISYSSLDRGWVKDWLLPRLERAGLRACIDFRNFDLGAATLANIENAVRDSRKTLLVMTPHWTQSEWTEFESTLVQTGDPAGRKRRLIPILLEACDLPDRLDIITRADFTVQAQWDTELNRVIKAISESPTPPPTYTAAQHEPNLVHPYPMQDNFTGRMDERKELTAWLANDAKSICALIAMGGMGKSALAWHWMQEDVLGHTQSDDAPTIEGVMWWSFYEGESSFAKFIDEAFKYVSGQQSIDTTRFPTAYDRAQELRQLLQHKRVLFILDGFERQLRAYASLDAAYRADDDTNPSRDELSCVDPQAARWLSGIAAGPTRAKLLLTTRLMPRDLEDRAGGALAGVLKRELRELPRDDAVKFMRAQGVTKGTHEEIATACKAYGYHPLSLRLLSGLIARDARLPGDIAAAPRHDVSADLIQRQHHVLEQSYNVLPKGDRALLSRLAAFRSPMEYDAVAIFNKFGNESRFEAALKDLQARGLLQRDMARNRYDLHPIVRRYAYDRLSDKKGTHTRLRDYFASIPAPDKNKVRSIEDLLPIIELYHHTARAGRYDEARELFRDWLSKPLYYRFGAYQICIELLRALFADSEERSPRLKDEHAQGWTLNELANSYSLSGQPRRAVRAFQVGKAIAEKLGKKKNLAVGLGNIAIQQMILGELAAAETNLRRSIQLGHEIEDRRREAVGYRELGRLFAYRGDFDEAESKLQSAQDFFDKKGGTNFVSLVRAYRALRAMLMCNARDALELARQARTLADEVAKIHYPFERDFIRAEWLLGSARILEGKNLSAANAHLTEAITRCRRINLVDFEPDILLAWARLYRARGEEREALAYAEEALAIADRCEYRLKQAEIHNFLARLALEAGNGEKARAEAEIAKERAWCDGPPYCYKPALDEAEGLLRELSVES